MELIYQMHLCYEKNPSFERIFFLNELYSIWLKESTFKLNTLYITFAISYRLSLGMQLMSLKSFQFNYLIIYKLSLQFLVNLFPLLLDFALCHRVYYHNIIFACPSRNKDVFVRTITSTMPF